MLHRPCRNPLTSPTDRIRQFLSTFTSQDKDLVDGMADINLHADEPQRKNMKYMQQLVRIHNYSCFHSLIGFPATSGE